MIKNFVFGRVLIFVPNLEIDADFCVGVCFSFFVLPLKMATKIVYG